MTLQPATVENPPETLLSAVSPSSEAFSSRDSENPQADGYTVTEGQTFQTDHDASNDSGFDAQPSQETRTPSDAVAASPPVTLSADPFPSPAPDQALESHGAQEKMLAATVPQEGSSDVMSMPYPEPEHAPDSNGSEKESFPSSMGHDYDCDTRDKENSSCHFHPISRSLRVVGIVPHAPELPGPPVPPPAPVPTPNPDPVEDCMVIHINGLRMVVRDIIDVDNFDPTRMKPRKSLDGVTDRDWSVSPEPCLMTTNDDEGDGPNEESTKPHSCWNRMIFKFQAVVTRILQAISSVAVRFPRACLIVLSGIAIGLCVAGLFTNFYIETQISELWPPSSSKSRVDAQWLWRVSRFSFEPVVMDVLIHKNGDNVLGQQGVQRVFQVVDYYSSLDGYKQGCDMAQRLSSWWWVGQCAIHSVADFWNASYDHFQDDVGNDDDLAIERLSATLYPTGVRVDVGDIMGKAVRDDTTGLLTSADAYLLRFDIPWSNVTEEFEARAVDSLIALKNAWADDPGNEWTLELRSWSSYSDEFMRALWADLWLIPISAFVVAVFTVTFAFGKCDRVYSRGLLGVGAVVTIVVSLVTSFGIMFLLGVPFTTNTLMVPFLLFGVGLDDAYIIMGSYSRLDPKMDIGERIKATFADVGVGIFLTTTTSVLAFILGSLSRIPAVQWLCLYALTAVAVDFVYQITFFIALIVLDEKRIQAHRMDWCTFITVDRDPTSDRATSSCDINGSTKPLGPQWEGGGDGSELVSNAIDSTDDGVASVAEQKSNKVVPHETSPESLERHCVDRLMGWWAIQLIKPWVQALSMTAFLGLTIASIYFATQLHQEFNFTDMVPNDSFLKSYYSSLEAYSDYSGLMVQAYFRYVDQSDPEVQEQMNMFMTDLVANGAVDQPVYFWLWDFQKYSKEMAMNTTDTFALKSFDEQVALFLKEEIYHELYGEHIAWRNNRNVSETKCNLRASVDIDDSKATVHLMNSVREVAAAQPINQNVDDWRFFVYTGEFHQFEFYKQVIYELVFDTIMGIIAVNAITIIFIPHWTAVLVVLPFICLLYVNLLGYLYLSGVQVNAISYVTLVMSIGLMVDYVLHILMRYYDCKGNRKERVHETMSTLGASVFLGASSTFLGVMPLAMSTSIVLQNIFVTVVGLISFGIVNGLIFLPTVLSLVGPEG